MLGMLLCCTCPSKPCIHSKNFKNNVDWSVKSKLHEGLIILTTFFNWLKIGLEQKDWAVFNKGEWTGLFKQLSTHSKVTACARLCVCACLRVDVQGISREQLPSLADLPRSLVRLKAKQQSCQGLPYNSQGPTSAGSSPEEGGLEEIQLIEDNGLEDHWKNV